MSVYAAIDEALIVAGDKRRSSELQSLFKSTAGALAVLAGASVVFHAIAIELYTEEVRPITAETGNEVGIQLVPEAIEVVDFPPGLVAFVGGLVVLAILTTVSYRRIRSTYES